MSVEGRVADVDAARVRLLLLPAAVSTGGARVEMLIVNGSTQSVHFGLRYKIERATRDGWEAVPPWGDGPRTDQWGRWLMPSSGAAPGRHGPVERASIPPLRPGRYRLTKGVGAPYPPDWRRHPELMGQGAQLTAPFEVLASDVAPTPSLVPQGAAVWPVLVPPAGSVLLAWPRSVGDGTNSVGWWSLDWFDPALPPLRLNDLRPRSLDVRQDPLGNRFGAPLAERVLVLPQGAGSVPVVVVEIPPLPEGRYEIALERGEARFEVTHLAELLRPLPLTHP